MKHRCTVPWPDQMTGALDGPWGSLTTLLRRAGWGMRQEIVKTRAHGPAYIEIRIAPRWAPDRVGLLVVSGVTLIWDDTEESLGVTVHAEPRKEIEGG